MEISLAASGDFAPLQSVLPPPALAGICPLTADQCVGARPTSKDIRPFSSSKEILIPPAYERVAARIALEGIRSATSDQRVVVTPTEDQVVSTSTGKDVVAAEATHDVWSIGSFECVVTSCSNHLVTRVVFETGASWLRL